MSTMKQSMHVFVLSALVVYARGTSYGTPRHCLKSPAPGTCRAWFPSWFYDPSSHQCKSFIYGGCGGNSNRFASEWQCQGSCLPGVPRRPVCSLPPVTGPCRGRFISWAYDPAAGHCRFFLYGGCYGNANSFTTCTGCMKRCTGRKLNEIAWVCQRLVADMNRYVFRVDPSALEP